MPIYEYACQSCDSKFEQLQRSMSSTETIACPECGSKKTKRALSVFAVAADTAKSGGSNDPAPSCGRCGNAPGSCGM